MGTALEDGVEPRRRTPRTDIGTVVFGAIMLGVLAALVVLVLKMDHEFGEVVDDGTPSSCAKREVDLAGSLVDDSAFDALAASFETVDRPASSCDPDASVGQVDSSYRSIHPARKSRELAISAVLGSGWRSLEPGGCYKKEYGERELIGNLDVGAERVWFQILVVPAGHPPECD